MPAVSVIIAALDAHDTLGAAIDSALAQHFSDFEIVIAPDEPADYSAFAARDPRIRVVTGVPVPTGPGPARNRAVAAAQGDWIALLDADDLWSPDYLGALMRAAAPVGAASLFVLSELLVIQAAIGWAVVPAAIFAIWMGIAPPHPRALKEIGWGMTAATLVSTVALVVGLR